MSHLDRLVTLNGPGLLRDLQARGWRSLLPLLVPCGLLSLARFLVRRWQEEGEAQRLVEEAQRRAAEAQAGVWPPPIRPDRHYDGKRQGMK